MTRLRRITADWDFKNPLKVLFYLNRSLKFLNKKQGEKLILKKSNSKGYHLFLWTRTYGDKNKIRKYLGEDLKHLAMDKKHRYGKQTLFFKKKKYKSKRGIKQ